MNSHVKCSFCGISCDCDKMIVHTSLNACFCNKKCQLSFYAHYLDGMGKHIKFPILGKGKLPFVSTCPTHTRKQEYLCELSS